jgi:hypothetical protein
VAEAAVVGDLRILRQQLSARCDTDIDVDAQGIFGVRAVGSPGKYEEKHE